MTTTATPTATATTAHTTVTTSPDRSHWTPADVTLTDGTAIHDQGFGVDAYGWDDRLDDWDL